MNSAKQVAENIRFMNNLPPGVVAYTINGAAVKDSWENILVIYNGSSQSQSVAVPRMGWKTFIVDNSFGPTVKNSSTNLAVAPHSCMILFTD